MANWIEVKVRYDRMMDNGLVKRQTELYLVPADSFREALETFTKGMKDTLADYEIEAIAETKIVEVYRHRAIAPDKAIAEA